MNFVYRKSFIKHILVHLYLIINFIDRLYFQDTFRFLAGLLGTLLFFISYDDFLRFLNKNIILFIIFYFLFVGYVLNSLYILDGLAIILQIFASIGIALFFIKEEFSENVFLFYLIYFFSFIIYRIFVIRISPNEIFEYASQNAIAYLALVYTVPYYFIRIRNNKPIKLFPSVLCLILGIVGIGRSGMAVTFCLFIYILLFTAKYSKFHRLIALTLVVCSLMFIYFYRGMIIEIIDLYKQIKRVDVGSAGLLSSGGRTDLWKEYIFSLKWYEWIIGKDLINYRGRLYLFRQGNFHNSFVFLHARCGFVAILFALYFIVLIIKRKFSDQMKFYSMLLLFILFKGFFDHVYFFMSDDFIIMGLLFSLSTSNNDKSPMRILGN
ncbi:hypothetical protein AGMMS49944_06070 [Spirochaetia bacterium]|nr:hypothetical protein AGMMS49944_06070 [Spirochaetia bacterium]